MKRHPGPLVVATSIGGERHLDLRGPAPFPPDQLFQIGSVTKTFTALLLARRLVSGELTLDTPVADLLPSAAPVGGDRPVTVGELATHRSGLPRVPRSMWRKALTFDDDPYREYGDQQLADDLLRVRPRRRGRLRYSNLGMGLLGHALAHAAGTSYDALVHREICAPLGLVDTTAAPSHEQRTRLAIGHKRLGKPRTVAWEFDALAGAGALWSTGNDLLAYLEAHLAPPEGPLGAALERVLVEPVLAWQSIPRGKLAGLWWHNGGTAGFRSMVVLDPERRRASLALAAIDRGVEAVALDALEQN
ncbi:serine hydrolase domain-containing protein [Nocardioides sp.]|uniref:serine hydrolase domain-containing protein n=1 Tax=Nocardioides sp. TaxID=35761 RepID=UPI002ED1B4D0